MSAARAQQGEAALDSLPIDAPDGPDAAAHHCLDCGACCFSNNEASIRVTGDDYERLGDLAEDVVHFVGHRAYMRLGDGHCIALRIEREGRFVCAVYERRPSTCRDLERGSPECAGERLTKAGRAESRLVQLRKASG